MSRPGDARGPGSGPSPGGGPTGDGPATARRSVLLVGATDGIGAALAREYARRGWRVAVVGRDAAKLRGLVGELEGVGAVATGVVCDVRDPARTRAAWEEAIAASGSLDLLVYCAGVQPAAATTDERVDGIDVALDVNVAGAVRFLELAAEHMAARGGRLAAIGSVAGVRGRKGDAGYGASKAALHAYLEGLRHRLHPRVGVSTIVPGFVASGAFLASRADDPEARTFPPAVTPERAARIIARKLERGADHFFVPWWWGLVAAALRVTPRFLYKRIAPA